MEIAKAEQVGHGLGHPAGGQVLAAQQVGDRRSHPRPVADRGPHPVGECGDAVVAAAAAAGVGPVLGHQRLHLGKLDDLAGGVTGAGVLAQGGAATVAVLGPVVDDVSGSADISSPEPLAPRCLPFGRFAPAPACARFWRSSAWR